MRLLLCCLLTIIIRRKEKGLDGEKSIVMMKRRKEFKRVVEIQFRQGFLLLDCFDCKFHYSTKLSTSSSVSGFKNNFLFMLHRFSK